MALASPRASAQIIPLPGAAVAPVVNTRRPGRWPACVVPARQLAVLRARTAAQQAEYDKQRELVEYIGNCLWAAETRLELLALAMPATAKAVHHV